MKTLVEMVKGFSQKADELQNERSLQDIMGSAMSELGETAIEVNIETGHSYKQPSPDGVVGEAVDTIMCMLDLIHRHSPDFTEEDLANIAMAKGSKWIEKLEKHKGIK
jgi:hypothetical protein